MKMAKASQKDIDAADQLVQILEAIDERFGGPYGIYGIPEDLPALVEESGSFDWDNLQHLQTLYNHLAKLLRTAPNFHGRVISGMCHVILWEKNEILDPAADTLELHPKFAKIEAERDAAVSAAAKIEAQRNALLESMKTIMAGRIKGVIDQDGSWTAVKDVALDQARGAIAKAEGKRWCSSMDRLADECGCPDCGRSLIDYAGE